MKKNRQNWVLGWLLGGGAVALALAPMACGDGFSSSDCKASRTCSVGEPGGAAGQGQDDAVNGGGDNTPVGGNAGEVAGGEGGTGNTTMAQGGGETAPVDGAGPGCTKPEDCSNGDPSDGEELCKKGACVDGNPPPTVLKITPADKAAGKEPDSKIVIEFSEALDPDTVTSATIAITDGVGPVPGKLVYADDKVTFTPAAPLGLAQSYTVKVTTGVTDDAGAPLLAEATSTFSTRDGVWQSIDVVQDVIRDMSAADITASGEVLLSWMGAAGAECPVSARWFLKGAAGGAATVLSPANEKLCSSVNAATNAEGVASVVWKDHDTKYNVYNRQYRAGAWSAAAPPLIVSDSNSSFVRPIVAPNGIAMLLQSESAIGMKAWTTDVNGVWPAQGTTTALLFFQPTVSFAFDAEGNAFAAWPDVDSAGTGFEHVVASSFTPAAGWGFSTPLPGSATSTAFQGSQKRGAPAIAFDGNGDGMALWANASSGSKLMASRYSKKNGWSEPELVSGNLNVKPIFEPAGLVFDGHEFVAAWTADEGGNPYTYTARYDLKTGWGAFQKRQSMAGDGTSSLRPPRLAGDGRGNLILVWAKGAAPTFTLVYQRYAGGAWGPITSVPGGTVASTNFEGGEDLTLSMNASGLAALAWANYANTGYINGIRLASFY